MRPKMFEFKKKLLFNIVIQFKFNVANICRGSSNVIFDQRIRLLAVVIILDVYRTLLLYVSHI